MVWNNVSEMDLFTDLVRHMYLISIVGVAFCILLYTLVEIYQSNIFDNQARFLYLIPLVASIPMIIYMPVERPGVSTYEFGMAVYVSMTFTVIYILIFGTYAFKNKMLFENHRWNTIILAGIVFLGCGLFQLKFQQSRIMSLGISILLIYMYSGLENPDEYVDKNTDIFNRDAFHIFMKDKCNQKKRVSLAYILINETDNLKDTAGGELALDLIRKVVDYLRTIPGGSIFAMGSNEFVMVYEKNEFFIDKVQSIKNRFADTWDVVTAHGEVELEIEAQILVYPAQRMNRDMVYDEIMDTITYFVEYMRMNTNEKYLCIDRMQVRQKAIYDHVKKELMNAVKESRIEVYYQPVYSVYENKCPEIEAVLRVRDSRDVYLDDFIVIPIIEADGSIVEIGYELFKQVCRFVATNNLRSMGITTVAVNLSMIQCQQRNLASNLIKIMEMYNVSASMFRFEVSESTAEYYTQNLRRNINQLVSQGADIIIDDFGSKSFNPDNITQISTSSIKIGRKVIKSYFEGKVSRQYLRILCRMLQQMKITMTAVGVETQQQYNELKKLGITQMQGYAFYKPMPEAELIQTMEKEQAIGLGQGIVYERVL